MLMSPRGTIVHDEYHAFWALSHFDRRSTTYTFPFNKWTFSLYTSHTNKHKLTHTLLLSLWLNCSNFDQQLRVQSRYKHCRNLHYHHKESSIPLDVNNLKSLITFHVLSRTYPCRNSKFSWQRQHSLCLVHSAQFHSQIISFSFDTLFLYFLSNCAHVGRGQLCSICEVSVLVVGSGHHDIPFHIFHRHYSGFVSFWTTKYPISPWSKNGHATYHSVRERERFQFDAIDSKYDDDGNFRKKRRVGSE